MTFTCYHYIIMRKYFYWIISFQLTLFSCEKPTEEEINVDGFEIYEKVSGIRLKSSDQLMRVNMMNQRGDFLYAVDPNTTHVISIINVKEDKLIKRFGRIGQGPCELDRIVAVMQVPDNPNKVGFYCFRRFAYYEFEEEWIMDENIVESLCDVQINQLDQGFNRLINLGMGRFLGTGYFEKKYAMTDSGSTESAKFFLDYHFQNRFIQEHQNRSLTMASQGDLVLKPDGSRVFFGARNFIAFDILGISENYEVSLVKRQEHTPPSFRNEGDEQNLSVAFSEENIFGYKKTVASDRFIYALFSGNKKKRYDPSNVVLVYNWDGDPVKVIKLDREVELITVSEDDSYLTGSIDDGRANLYRFDLP